MLPPPPTRCHSARPSPGLRARRERGRHPSGAVEYGESLAGITIEGSIAPGDFAKLASLVLATRGRRGRVAGLRRAGIRPKRCAWGL